LQAVREFESNGVGQRCGRVLIVHRVEGGQVDPMSRVI
jgi:hypothetical protein